MKSILRYTATIAVTAMVALGVAVAVLGTPSADAQPSTQPSTQAPAQTEPQPAQPSNAVPTVTQPDKGAAAGGDTGQPNSAAAPATAPAPGAAPAAGAPPAAPAAPAAPGKPTIIEVPCETAKLAATYNGVVDGDLATGDVVKFIMPPGIDAVPDTAAGAGLEVEGGQTRCLRFDKDGQFLYHSRSGLHGALTVRQWYDILVNKPIDDLRGGNFWMPKAVNRTADDSDSMYYAVLGLSIFFFFGIAGAVVYFCIKYRHRPGHKAEPSAAHNDALEITWTVIPTIICVFLFYYGWNTYVHVVTPPTKAVEINVLAWRWNWQFTHSNGVQDSDLHVPVNTPVRLVMTSKDVLHSFYAPVMRVKQDIIPRRYTYAWFFPTKPGTYRLTCAEYCGTNHSQMGITNDGRRAVLVVHEPGGYERYLSDKAAQSSNMNPVDLGRLLYEKKGCNACHTTDGSPRVGPTWKATFGTTVPLADGTSVKMDETYIRESLLAPQAKSRPGFPPSMPSFEGQLKDKEIEGLIAFIKSLQ
jgi:cytochrome c oxidase subunit 2